MKTIKIHKHGHFVGITEHVGHAMNFKTITDDTHKIIYRSNISDKNRDNRDKRIIGDPNGELHYPI